MGVATDYLDGIDITIDPDATSGHGPVGVAIRGNRSFWINDFTSDPHTLEWRERGRLAGWGSVGSIPLRRGGQPVGTLSFYSRSTGAFDQDAVDLLEEMASDIAFALDAFDRDDLRRRAEAGLQQSEQRYRSMFSESAVPMIVVDPHRNCVVDGNDAALRFYGWPIEQLRSMPLEKIDAGGPDHIERELAGALEGRHVHTGLRHLTAQGDIRNVEAFTATLVVGDVPLVLATIIDVTARMQAEEAVRHHQYLLSEAQRIAHVGSWSRTREGGIEWSDETHRILGLPADTQPSLERMVALVHPADQASVAAHIDTAARGVRPSEGPFRIVRPDGQERYLLLRTDVQMPAGSPFVMAGTAQDVTEQARADAAIRESLREKEALLKEVHHRVKNNLQIVSSLLRLESGRTQDANVRSVLGDMRSRVMSMALLHETLYRSDNFARVDLAGYLRQLSGQIFRAMAPSDGRVDLALDLDPVAVELDRAVPCGLLVNELVSNALKHGFTDGRTGVVRVSLHPSDAGRWLRIEVVDTGAGLPADFEVRRGSSLGLQLVTDLARQLDGHFAVDSTAGTRFSVTFPQGPSVRTEGARELAGPAGTAEASA